MEERRAILLGSDTLTRYVCSHVLGWLRSDIGTVRPICSRQSISIQEFWIGISTTCTSSSPRLNLTPHGIYLSSHHSRHHTPKTSRWLFVIFFELFDFPLFLHHVFDSHVTLIGLFFFFLFPAISHDLMERAFLKAFLSLRFFFIASRCEHAFCLCHLFILILSRPFHQMVLLPNTHAFIPHLSHRDRPLSPLL